jgi:hypothetical protein
MCSVATPRSTLTRMFPTTPPSASATSTRCSAARIISLIQKLSDGSLTAPGAVISQRPSRRTSANRRASPRPSVGRAGRSVQRRPSWAVLASPVPVAIIRGPPMQTTSPSVCQDEGALRGTT